MAILKIGESIEFSKEDILAPKQALGDDKIVKRFIKLAKTLKRIAPRASDFVYASCITMHAAEAALINQDTGEPILNSKGEPVQGYFEEFKNAKGRDSLRWVSPDGIKPYKNQNGDLFAEDALLLAHKKFIGKPVCRDHVSDSVDGIRGIIVDTYYCPKYKRMHSLLAIDKKNYGDLARKVETGCANSVSMGTAVGEAICTECGNIATTEKEYCKCIRSRSNYGEINRNLSPIEISLVVNGADQLAKIKHIVASMNSYVQNKQKRIDKLVNDRCVNPAELQSLSSSISDIKKRLDSLVGLEKSAATDLGENVAAIREMRELQKRISEATDPSEKEILEQLLSVLQGGVLEGRTKPDNKWPPQSPASGLSEPSFSSMVPGASDAGGPAEYSLNSNPVDRGSVTYASNIEEGKQGASQEISLLRSKVENLNNSFNELKKLISKEENNMNSARLRARAMKRRAYWQGGGGVNEPTPGKTKYEKDPLADKVRDNEDKQMTGEPLDTGSEGLHPGDKEIKEKLLRAELEERKMKRRAYWLGGGGVNEPTPGKTKYDKEEADKIRNTEDKQMTGTYDMGGTDGTVPGDMEVKKKLSRARLRAKFTKVSDATGNLRKDASRWDIYAGDQLILSANGEDIYGDQLDANWDYLSSKDYGKEVIANIRTEGFDTVAYWLKGIVKEAQPPVPAAPEVPAEMPPELAAPEAPAEEPKVDVEKGDETQSKVEAALTTMEEKIAEIRELSSGIGEELVDIDVNIKDQEGGPEGEVGPMEEALASKQNLIEIVALMDESADELALISEAIKKGDEEDISSLISEALSDSNAILAQADLVLEAKKKKEEDKEKEEDKKDKEDKDDKKEEKDDKKEEKEENGEEDKEAKAQKLLDEALKIRAQNRADLVAQAGHCAKCHMPQADCSCPGAQEQPAEDGACEPEDCDDCSDAALDAMLADDSLLADDGAVAEESAESLRLARKQARESLMAEASDKILGKYQLDLGPAQNATEKTYFEAHPGGKGTVTELTGTKTPEAKVETISEIHDVMRDVAESGPRNIREAAALLQEGIVKGAFTAGDIDVLVAEGKVDATAAAYWKKYFAQGPDTGSFGADLSKEFAGKKKEASNDVLKIKMRRAYGLGLQAQDKGFIDSSRVALDTYVDDVMKLSDDAFESTKRIIANMSSAKKGSGKLPVVGANAATEAMNVTASLNQDNAIAGTNPLDALGWTDRPKAR